MANELRSRTDGVAGATTDNPLTSGATTMNSAGLADLPAITSTNHAAITLFVRDSNGRITAREVVWVTAHTAAATSATIVRAKEGTSAVEWPSGSLWVHGPTALDTQIRADVKAASVATGQASTSTTYTDLTTAGPAVTVTIGPSGAALVILSANYSNATNATYAVMSFAVSGASTLAADDSRALFHKMAAVTQDISASRIVSVTGLTAGSNTFTAKYRVTAGTGTWAYREITVIPL